MLIVVGNEKGGCGKTTLAVHLAAAAAHAGRDALLVDSDPGQQSAARWAARRREAHPEANAVRCVSLTGRAIRDELEDLTRRYQVVVVDTGAEDSPELRAAVTVAGVLVIPLQPEPLDLWTLPTMEALVARARSFNPSLRVVVAVNRIPHQLAAQTPQEIAGWIAENTPQLAAPPIVPIVGRTAYGRAIGEGLAVHETPRPDLKATREMEALYQEVTR